MTVSIPKVSIILPVYNVSQYIEKCVTSLLLQTLHDMEFIFVDDHGQDNSIELVKKMIKGNPREEQFVFLTPPQNLGAGMARNYALQHAKGEYVAFVDPDDWVENDAFARLYAEAKHYEADLCYGQLIKDREKQKQQIATNPIVESGPFTTEKRQFFLTHFISLFSSFIYKTNFLKQYNVHFAESRNADDSFFITSALLIASSIAHINYPFYHYLIREGSVTTVKDSNKYKKRLTTFKDLLQYVKAINVYEKFKEEIDFIYIKKGTIASIFNYISNSTAPLPTTLHTILEELKNLIPQYKKNTYLNNKFSVKFLMYLIEKHPKIAISIIQFHIKLFPPIV